MSKYNSSTQNNGKMSWWNANKMLGCPSSSGRFPVTRCRVCNVPIPEYKLKKGPYCDNHLQMRGKI